MRSFRLQHKFVKLLQHYYEKEGWTPTREEFLQRVLRTPRFRWNYIFTKRETLQRMFDDSLGDCVEGVYQYISYTDAERSKLKVTLEGRDFIAFGGWFQELFKRRDKLAMFLFGGGAGVVGMVVLWIASMILSLVT